MLPRALRYWFEPWEHDELGRKRFGTWSQSYTGRQYWIMDPRPEEICMTDVVVGLVNASRYRGQTQFYYCVAQHSVLVSEKVEEIALQRGFSRTQAAEASFQGLLHDATEAYLGDVARPLKRMKAMKGYRKLEKLWEDAVYERFDVRNTPETDALVDEVDKRIVLDEIYAIMRDPGMWARNNRYPDMQRTGAKVEKLTIEEASNRFYERYKKLRPWDFAVVFK